MIEYLKMIKIIICLLVGKLYKIKYGYVMVFYYMMDCNILIMYLKKYFLFCFNCFLIFSYSNSENENK